MHRLSRWRQAVDHWLVSANYNGKVAIYTCAVAKSPQQSVLLLIDASSARVRLDMAVDKRKQRGGDNS